MSSMLPGGPPPAAIHIGGPNHGMPALPPGLGAPGLSAPGPGASDNGPGDPDSGSVATKLRQALKLVQAAADQEGDDADTAALHSIAANIAKAIANETGLADKVMGGGDGAKMIRKAANGGGGY